MTLARLVVVLVLFASVSVADAAGPKTIKVPITKAVATKGLGALTFGDRAVVAATLKYGGTTPPIVHTLTFKARTAGLTVGTAWRVGTAASPIRLVGVNIDLFDASNVLVASDVFASTLDGYALSTLTTDGLIAGASYHMVLTGTQVGTVAYLMTIETR